jgi:hypothetical protein
MLELWNIFRNRDGLLIGWSNDGLLFGKYLVSAHNQIINASGLHQLNNAPCLH